MDLGIVIAVLALGTGLVAVLKMPRQMFGSVPDPETKARLEAMEDEIAALRERLTAAEERLDFTERALTRTQDPRRVGKGDTAH